MSGLEAKIATDVLLGGVPAPTGKRVSFLPQICSHFSLRTKVFSFVKDVSCSARANPYGRNWSLHIFWIEAFFHSDPMFCVFQTVGVRCCGVRACFFCFLFIGLDTASGHNSTREPSNRKRLARSVTPLLSEKLDCHYWAFGKQILIWIEFFICLAIFCVWTKPRAILFQNQVSLCFFCCRTVECVR